MITMIRLIVHLLHPLKRLHAMLTPSFLKPRLYILC